MNIIEFAILKKMFSKGGGSGGGESYALCEVSFFDDEGAGPFEVIYKYPDGGVLMNKAATIPCGDSLIINAARGTEIFISGATNCGATNVDNLTHWYEDGGLHIVIPDVDYCDIIICS